MLHRPRAEPKCRKDRRTLFSRLLPKTWFKPSAGFEPSFPPWLLFTFSSAVSTFHFICDTEKWICHANLTDRNWRREELEFRCQKVWKSAGGGQYCVQTVRTKEIPGQLPCQGNTSANIFASWGSDSERLQCCILFPGWTAMVSWSSSTFHFLLQLINISASWRAAGGWVIPSAADFGSRAFVLKYFKQNEKQNKFCCLMIFCLISATSTAAHTGRVLSYNLLWLICKLACIYKVSLHSVIYCFTAWYFFHI